MSAIRTKEIERNVGTFRLRNLTVSIPKEKVTGIVGPNGSGKSTFLKIIARLLDADKGKVYVHDKPAKEYRAKEFARTLAMLTQTKENLPNLTVRELVAYGRSPYKRTFEHRLTEEDKRIIDWAMEITRTKSLENRMFPSLSGGEQQRVRIAMALAQNTSILLLDEPTTFLDIAHQLEVMEMLQEINRKYRITIVMVLHDLQQAAKYCHQLIAMKDGKIVASGSPKSIVTSDFLKEVYDIEAKVTFEDDFAIIIPIKRRNE